MTELLDARGVPIAPGDTAIYGFGVSRSVAMAEAVVLGEAEWKPSFSGQGDWGDKVSLTPSGRVRLRVVRRSYSSGEKPVVDVAPDRLVVLKHYTDVEMAGPPYLPPSPLPTQADKVRESLQWWIDTYTNDLRKPAPESWEGETGPSATAAYYAWCARRLAEHRAKLKALGDG